ncbi:MAG TPA: hypothetical protein VM123_12785 [archaeon]|nr:hypothetical protein [archaeon]
MRQQIASHGRFPKLVLYCIFAVITISLSCDSEGKYDYRVLGPDETVNRYDIIVVSGNYQTGVIGKPLPDSLIVYVSQNYIPAKGWRVDFKIIKGEGTLSPENNVTDVGGYTGTTLTPGGIPGEIQVEITPFNSDRSVIFTATSTDQ